MSVFCGNKRVIFNDFTYKEIFQGWTCYLEFIKGLKIYFTILIYFMYPNNIKKCIGLRIS
jgi:hypothetical protein